MKPIPRDIHTYQLLEELDAFMGKKLAIIRTAWEVETDKAGRAKLHRAMEEVNAMYDHFSQIIARLEWDNLELNMAVKNEARLEWENKMLKDGLRMRMLIDEVGTGLKERIIKLKIDEHINKQ